MARSALTTGGPMDRRTLALRLVELARGVLEGSLDRPAMLVALATLYGELGGAREALFGALPPGTQIGLDGSPAAVAAQARRTNAALELKRRAERIVRYWIVRTGRDAART